MRPDPQTLPPSRRAAGDAPRGVDALQGMTSVACASRAEFDVVRSSPPFLHHRAVLESLATGRANAETFVIDGYCLACDRATSFRSRRRASEAGTPWTGWREGLRCDGCGMNSRKRAMCWFIAQTMRTLRPAEVYVTEQVTTLYGWLAEHFDGALVGSEYIGAGTPPGEVREGIRHEDVESLSFPAERFDLVVSLDVLAHVNRPGRAVDELRRVLRPGGQLLFTVPFGPEYARNVTRAHAVGDEIVHFEKPVHYDDPMSSDGSLVFTDFGWELFEQLSDTFGVVEIELYHSWQYGHLGSNLFFFRCRP
jgi:SAM-dependent methyltransferase